MKQRSKRILAIHDLSGFGHTSLMAIIPIMYSRGIQVCALPTALLSSNTCYAGFVMQDTTEFMKSMLEHWLYLGMQFDAIYSGFLGSPQQATVLHDLIDKFCHDSTLIVVDPVLADDGQLYSCYDTEMVHAIKSPLQHADIITPNFTEACLLTDTPYRLDPDEALIDEICDRLSQLGPRHIGITSIPTIDPEQTLLAYYNTAGQGVRIYPCRYIPCYYPGTGDIFTTVLTAEIMNGIPIEIAIQTAIDFVYDAILLSLDVDSPHQEGVCLELMLGHKDVKDV